METLQEACQRHFFLAKTRSVMSASAWRHSRACSVVAGGRWLTCAHHTCTLLSPGQDTSKGTWTSECL